MKVYSSKNGNLVTANEQGHVKPWNIEVIKLAWGLWWYVAKQDSQFMLPTQLKLDDEYITRSTNKEEV